ncbi:MAG: hypothetical protein R3E08_03710 [Thiotrichaceae bacterium]
MLTGCTTTPKLDIPPHFKFQSRATFTPTPTEPLLAFESEVKDDGNYRLGARSNYD